MPKLAKKVISQFILSGCMRRLRLNLYPANKTGAFPAERAKQGMPKPLKPRPGWGQLTKEGREWEDRVFRDLISTFGSSLVHVGGDPSEDDIRSGRCFSQQKLAAVLGGLKEGHFVIEPEYDVVEAFKHRFDLDKLNQELLKPRGENLEYAEVRPDIIQVRARPANGQAWYRLTGKGHREKVPAYDGRLGLRVIDVKLTAEPSPAHFAEIALYSMVLADWLEQNGFNDRFFVEASGAVWPGKHLGSALSRLEKELAKTEERKPTAPEAIGAMETDLESMPDDIFTARVRRFLLYDLRDALIPQNWKDLEWHPSNRCIGCDYLGYRWTMKDEIDDFHCWPQAEREGHLSRVSGLTKGARASLHGSKIKTVKELAATSPGDPAFERHHTLKATRTTVSCRAKALDTGKAELVERSGSSASLPKWADIHIFLAVEFDRASGITISFGWRAKSWDTGAKNFTIFPNTPILIVEERSLVCEQKFLLQWLHGIARYLDDVQAKNPMATIQFYLWDEVSYEHLARVYARHLDAVLGDKVLAKMQWLFPPETVFEDPRYQDGKAPLTVVQPIVSSKVAADVPHYYSLISVSSLYYPKFFGEPPFTGINSFFRDPLSDHVPSERAHEIWSKVEKPVHYQEIQDTFRKTVKHKLLLFDHVVSRLSQELPTDTRPDAPTIAVLNERPGLAKVCWDGQLWYEFTALNDAVARYENEMIRAMPNHEREARFHSVRLEERLVGKERDEALKGEGILPLPNIYVFRMRRNSVEAKLRAGKDFLSLMPEKWLHLTMKTLGSLEYNELIDNQTIAAVPPEAKRTRLQDACEVKLLAFNRQTRLAIVQGTWFWDPNFLLHLEADSRLTFDFNLSPKGPFAIIDPIYKGFLLKRVKNAVSAIGNPPLAQQRPLMAQIPAHIKRAKRGATAATPADFFLWDAKSLAQEVVSGDPANVAEVISNLKHPPTDKQTEAFKEALTRRLFVLWGPPGTGKSETAAAIILGKVALARREQRPLRILVTGPTWVAIDNVAKKLPPLLETLGYNDVDILVPHSRSTQPHGLDGRVAACAIPATINEPQYANLITQLKQPTKITIVATTPHQVPPLIEKIVSKGAPVRAELFDFVLVDESSQVDVATALLFLTGLAKNACLTVVGDHLQMPPIHQANMPEACKDMVGSLYDFYQNCHKVEPVMLDKNFRSNREIIDFIKHAGYRKGLHSNQPGLRVHYPCGIPEAAPPGWPKFLAFSSEFEEILAADKPLVCIIHDDGECAQCNYFEAQLTAGLVRSLYGTLGAELAGKSKGEPTSAVYDGKVFFKHGVGIVTPHRAQQAEVIRLLEEAMPPEVSRQEMTGAVDTVERFQGQEKDVMIATFALGDPDTILQEEEFIFGLERFNVIASRAKAKLIVIISSQLADHLPSDIAVMRASRLLKRFVDGHLLNESVASISYMEESGVKTRSCFIRS